MADHRLLWFLRILFILLPLPPLLLPLPPLHHIPPLQGLLHHLLPRPQGSRDLQISCLASSSSSSYSSSAGASSPPSSSPSGVSGSPDFLPGLSPNHLGSFLDGLLDHSSYFSFQMASTDSALMTSQPPSYSFFLSS